MKRLFSILLVVALLLSSFTVVFSAGINQGIEPMGEEAEGSVDTDGFVSTEEFDYSSEPNKNTENYDTESEISIAGVKGRIKKSRMSSTQALSGRSTLSQLSDSPVQISWVGDSVYCTLSNNNLDAYWSFTGTPDFTFFDENVGGMFDYNLLIACNAGEEVIVDLDTSWSSYYCEEVNAGFVMDLGSLIQWSDNYDFISVAPIPVPPDISSIEENKIRITVQPNVAINLSIPIHIMSYYKDGWGYMSGFGLIQEAINDNIYNGTYMGDYITVGEYNGNPLQLFVNYYFGLGDVSLYTKQNSDGSQKGTFYTKYSTRLLTHYSVSQETFNSVSEDYVYVEHNYHLDWNSWDSNTLYLLNVELDNDGEYIGAVVTSSLDGRSYMYEDLEEGYYYYTYIQPAEVLPHTNSLWKNINGLFALQLNEIDIKNPFLDNNKYSDSKGMDISLLVKYPKSSIIVDDGLRMQSKVSISVSMTNSFLGYTDKVISQTIETPTSVFAQNFYTLSSESYYFIYARKSLSSSYLYTDSKHYDGYPVISYKPVTFWAKDDSIIPEEYMCVGVYNPFSSTSKDGYRPLSPITGNTRLDFAFKDMYMKCTEGVWNGDEEVVITEGYDQSSLPNVNVVIEKCVKGEWVEVATTTADKLEEVSKELLSGWQMSVSGLRAKVYNRSTKLCVQIFGKAYYMQDSTYLQNSVREEFNEGKISYSTYASNFAYCKYKDGTYSKGSYKTGALQEYKNKYINTTVEDVPVECLWLNTSYPLYFNYFHNNLITIPTLYNTVDLPIEPYYSNKAETPISCIDWFIGSGLFMNEGRLDVNDSKYLRQDSPFAAENATYSIIIPKGMVVSGVFPGTNNSMNDNWSSIRSTVLNGNYFSSKKSGDWFRLLDYEESINTCNIVDYSLQNINGQNILTVKTNNKFTKLTVDRNRRYFGGFTIRLKPKYSVSVQSKSDLRLDAACVFYDTNGNSVWGQLFYADDGSWLPVQGLFQDLDGNGETSDLKIAKNSFQCDATMFPQISGNYLSVSDSSGLTGQSVIVNPRDNTGKDYYYYNMNYSIISDASKNVVLYSVLEDLDDVDWKGTLIGIEEEQSNSLLNPTIYVNDGNLSSSQLVQQGISIMDLVESKGWVELNKYLELNEDLSKITAVAVSYGETIFKANDSAYPSATTVRLKMRAAPKEEIDYASFSTTKNRCFYSDILMNEQNIPRTVMANTVSVSIDKNLLPSDNVMPETGGTGVYNIILIGILFVFVGVVLLKKCRI